MKFPYSRKQRLTTPTEYRKTLRSSKRVHHEGITLCVRKKKMGLPRLGLIIAKREIPKAVKRNLLKRLIRESFRLNQRLMGEYDLVIMVKRKCLTKTKKEITTSLERLWTNVCAT